MHNLSARGWKSLATGAVAAVVLATVGFGAPLGAAADAPTTPATTPGQLFQKLSPSLASPVSGRRAVFVQLSGTGAADAADAASSVAAGKTAAKSRRTAIASSATAAFGAAKGKDGGAKKLFTVTNSIPGFAATVDDAALAALAARSDVVSITPLTPKHVDNSSTAELTQAIADWHAGNLGEGVTVGVIDTGIDYTHADFGGAGTVAAWDAAHAASAGAWTPTVKVAGGYDFVGDDYNADPDAVDYQPVPQPDTNPLDCGGHGTHVAGTVAGYGVTGAGATFGGDYASLSASDLAALRIGPGMAPRATLYALKVFGCTGSTDAVIPALDWALDPNGDGDFSDHLDIINLSLGADFAAADDPENAVIDYIAKRGVLPVISAGNAGDLTDAGGAPGSAVRALTVASTVDAFQLRDGLQVTAPADVAGIADGQFSVAYPWSTAAPVSGSVVVSPSGNPDGCAAYPAGSLAGKVVWQSWDDNDATRRCGSAARAANARAGGAIGAIFTSTLDVFAAGITGDPIIPVVQLPKSQTDRLAAAASAGTLQVTFDGALAASVKSVTPSITDTLSSFSSRGTHGSVGVVKPDIAAPGDSIASANIGTGSGVLAESGTSMAAPNVAGIAALVVKAHPTWSPEQVKADLMNTAGHDVYVGDGQTGPIFGPNRVGAGRVDARAAVTNSLLVYGKDLRGGVSASFGVIAAPITSKTVTKTRTLIVQNTGTRSKTVTLAYQAVVSEPGVSYQVSPKKLTVGAGRTTTATVTITIVPSKLRHTIDPTQDPSSGIGVPRQYVSDASGRVLVTEPGRAALRVPVYAAVKPSSATSTKLGKTGSGSAAAAALILNGKGFAQGSGSEAFTSLASVLEFGASSPKERLCSGTQTSGCLGVPSDGVADLRYVGAGSTPVEPGSTDYSDGWLFFGVNTWGQGATIGYTTIPFVDFDVTGDGVPDYEVFVQNYPDTDVPLAWLVDLDLGETIDIEPVNFNFGDVDTNSFDTDTLLIPVWPAAIGVTPATTSFPITYQVGTVSAHVPGLVDSSPAIAYDVVDPAVAVGEPLYFDQAGTVIPFQLGADATTKTKALVLHLHGAPGSRAEVVSVTAPKHKASPWGKRYGAKSWHGKKGYGYRAWQGAFGR